MAAGDVGWLAHATTVVTNALLQGSGARTALITTQGCRDVLELRRSARASLYDLFQDAPAVLVPRHLRLEVRERVDAQGQVVEALHPEDVTAAVEFIRRHRIDAIAVCLLFSFLNDAHERAIGRTLRAAFPDVPVFLSSEVLPEIREFERTSTTAVCAYVGPILASYLGRLESAVTGMGLPSPWVMGSSGGVFSVSEGLRMPAMAVESGPAAGVIAAALVGRQRGLENIISFDMGGTTAKASLIERGEIKTTAEYEVGGGGNVRRWLHGTGHPIRVPVIDLAEVSAGGGSIAWIDPGGVLRVGPESAGADPGPVCYGPHGTRATVTDADLVLGYLNPVALLGGALPVSVERARAAIEAQIARPLGPRRARGRRRHRRGRERGHGGRAADRLGRARPRSARLHAGGLRRRRARARRAPGRRAGHPARAHPADPRRLLRARAGRHRRASRLRPHVLRRAALRRSRRDRRRLRGHGGRGARDAQPVPACPRSAGRSRARPTVVIRARPTS